MPNVEFSIWRSAIRIRFAEVAELVDALDSKSSMVYPMWGFESPLRHMFYVYVLRSLKDGGLYKGLTSDLDKRLKKHQAGGVPSTKNRRPLEVVYCETHGSRHEARKREKFLKSGPGNNFLKEVVGIGRRVPTRPDSRDKSG